MLGDRRGGGMVSAVSDVRDIGIPVLQLNCGVTADLGDCRLFLVVEPCSKDLRTELFSYCG